MKFATPSRRRMVWLSFAVAWVALSPVACAAAPESADEPASAIESQSRALTRANEATVGLRTIRSPSAAGSPGKAFNP